jgi:hypothetical protein
MTTVAIRIPLALNNTRFDFALFALTVDPYAQNQFYNGIDPSNPLPFPLVGRTTVVDNCLAIETGCEHCANAYHCTST